MGSKLAGLGVGLAVVLMLKLVVAVFAIMPVQTPPNAPFAPGTVGLMFAFGVPRAAPGALLAE